MKILPRILIALGIALSTPAHLFAQEVDGNLLNIYSAESNAYDGNTFDDNGSGSLLAGDGNSVSSSLYTSLLGYGNSVDTSESAFVSGEGNGNSGTRSSFVTGEDNTIIGGRANFAAGEINDIEGELQFGLGQGLISVASSVPSAAIVVGNYNSAVTNQLFVVGDGTGTGTTPRKNALEVYQDGTVKIPKRQGDIVMGQFGNGNGD